MHPIKISCEKKITKSEMLEGGLQRKTSFNVKHSSNTQKSYQSHQGVEEIDIRTQLRKRESKYLEVNVVDYPATLLWQFNASSFVSFELKFVEEVRGFLFFFVGSNGIWE